MKIFLMDTITSGEEDGAQVHKLELIKNLSLSGYEIHSISSRDIKNAHAHSLKIKKGKGFWGLPILYHLWHAMVLLKLIKTYRFDILYTRNISTGIFGYIVRKKGTKLVFEMNGVSPIEHRQEQLKGHFIKNRVENIKTAWSKYIEFFFARKADAIIVVTDEIKNYLVNHEIEDDKIWVIENGANTKLFRPGRNNAALNELKIKHSIINEENVVLFVGLLMPWQGVDYLIRAAPLVIKEIPKTKFLIVGGGKIEKLMSLCKALNVEKKFIFTGVVRYEDVAKYINISNICIAPFIKDRVCSPIKVFEYLSCGKPVVSSDIGGVRKILKESKAAILVTPENPVELAKAIIRLLKDEHLMEEMGKNGRDMVVNNYSWENTARKTVAVFEEIMRKEENGNNQRSQSGC